MDTEIILNIYTSKEVADDLKQGKSSSFDIESVEYTQEQTTHFGVLELVAIVGMVKTIIDAIKVGFDVRDLLKKKPGQSAQITTSNQYNSYIIIKGSMTNEEIENAIRQHFNN